MDKSLVQILDQVDEIEHSLIENGGLLSSELEFAQQETDGELKTKIDGYYDFITNLEGRAEIWRKRSAESAKIARGLEKRADSMREYAKAQMIKRGLTKLEGNGTKLTLSAKEPVLEIKDESKIPNDLKLIQYIPDKEKILERLKTDEVPGCELRPVFSLRITQAK